VPAENSISSWGDSGALPENANFVARTTRPFAKRVTNPKGPTLHSLHMCAHFYHRPLSQGSRLPSLWCQLFKERGKVDSLVVGMSSVDFSVMLIHRLPVAIST